MCLRSSKNKVVRAEIKSLPERIKYQGEKMSERPDALKTSVGDRCRGRTKTEYCTKMQNDFSQEHPISWVSGSVELTNVTEELTYLV